MIQTIITAIVIAVAFIYAAFRIVHRFRSRSFSGCSCCSSSSGCSLRKYAEKRECCENKGHLSGKVRGLRLGILFLTALCMPAVAQTKQNAVPAKYAAGAVPVVDGKVVFSQKYIIPSMSKAEIYSALKAFAGTLIKDENSLQQSRISADDESNGLLAVKMEEWMYFKRTAWVTNRTRFYYQLLFQVKDGGYEVILRDMHYYYDEEHNGGYNYDANTWITDEASLRKGGTKLSKINGKFRTKTIDRKDTLFKASYNAVKDALK